MRKFLALICIGAMVMAGCLGTQDCVAVGASGQSDIDISAKSAFLMEGKSGKTLFAKGADKQLPIASMVKTMTLALIYDALEDGRLKLDDDITVSPNASGMGGSQAFLDFDSVYKADDLIKSIVIASANDSCVALAEHLYGSESAFVDKMNQKAAELGMVNTNFANCTGLPAVGGYSSAEDVAKMYAYIMKSPFYGKDHSIWMYDLQHPSGRVTGLTNTNKHARFFKDSAGGKTGFTKEAGHCIAVAGKRNNLEPIAVIIGASDSATRFAESARLLNHAFDNYSNKLIVDATKPIGNVKLQKAWDNNVNVFARENFYDLVQKGDKGQPTVNVEVVKSVSAPVSKDSALGRIIITEDGKVVKEMDVVASVDIKALTYGQAIKKIAQKFRTF